MDNNELIVEGLYSDGEINGLEAFVPPPAPSIPQGGEGSLLPMPSPPDDIIPDLRLDLPSKLDDDIESLYGSMSDINNCVLYNSLTSLVAGNNKSQPANPRPPAGQDSTKANSRQKPDGVKCRPLTAGKVRNVTATSSCMLTVPRVVTSPDPVTSRDIETTLSQSLLAHDQKIVINVGGKRFITFASTLEKVPNSRLSNPTEMQSAYDFHSGEYFYDRNPKFFGYILDFYRTGDLHFSHCLCGPAISKELEFWGIDENNISACCWRAYKTYEDEQRTLSTLELALEGNPKQSPEDLADIQRQKNFSKWRLRLWEFLDKPNSSKAAQAWAIFIFILILISIASVCLQTHPSFRVPRTDNYTLTQNITNPKKLIYYTTTPHTAIEYMDAICVFIFTIELVSRFAVSPSKLRYLYSIFNVIDIFCVVPMLAVHIIEQVDPLFWETRDFFLVITYLSLTSVLRVVRLLKLARHYKGLKILQLAVRSSLRELLLLFLLIFMGMLIFSTLIYFAEFEVDDNFPHIPIGFWWSIVTMTTVGYGDFAPKSGWGYLVGSICAVSGMLATGLPIPIIASNFNHYYDYARFRTKLTRKMAERGQMDSVNNGQIQMRELESKIIESPSSSKRNKVTPVGSCEAI